MAVPCGIWKNERLMFGVAHRYDDFYGDELGFQPFFYYATPKRLQEEIDGVLDTVSERGNRKAGIVVMMNSELYTSTVVDRVLQGLDRYLKKGGDGKFDEICLCLPDPEDEMID